MKSSPDVTHPSLVQAASIDLEIDINIECDNRSACCADTNEPGEGQFVWIEKDGETEQQYDGNSAM